MKIDVLVDLQYGSCGKGKFAPELAHKNRYDLVSGANMPNAGHTVTLDGNRRVYKVLPSASACATNLICPTAVLSPVRLVEEANWTGKMIYIHEGARLLVPGDVEIEENSKLHTISSTLQGCTPSMIRRINRDPLGRIGINAKIFSSLSDTPNVRVINNRQWQELLSDSRVLHEVAQGTLLSVDWGEFPYTTSRNCTSGSAIDSLGCAWSDINECYGLLRAHPIRVGGPSGPIPHETTWQGIGESAGIPQTEIDKIIEAERTTVTKKYRRVGRLDIDSLVYADKINGCTKLILNFAQYIDWSAFGAVSQDALPPKVWGMIDTIESATGKRVCAIGTSESTTIWR